MAEELYAVAAQYDTTEAIQTMSGLVQRSLEIQGDQVEMLAALRKSGEQQTTLTKWVLGFAIAAVIVAVLSVVAALAAAFLT